MTLALVRPVIFRSSLTEEVEILAFGESGPDSDLVPSLRAGLPGPGTAGRYSSFTSEFMKVLARGSTPRLHLSLLSEPDLARLLELRTAAISIINERKTKRVEEQKLVERNEIDILREAGRHDSNTIRDIGEGHHRSPIHPNPTSQRESRSSSAHRGGPRKGRRD